MNAAEELRLAGARAFRPGQPPAELKLRLQSVVAGLEQPIYVNERTGRIRVIENGDLREEPLLDLREQVDWAGERGLLGLAFAPLHLLAIVRGDYKYPTAPVTPGAVGGMKEEASVI